MHEFYVPLTTENLMSVNDVVKECHAGNWAPVIVIRYADERTVVPLFRGHEDAMKFIFRNFGKEFKPTSGTIGINSEHFDIFTNKGWEVEILNFPRKFTGHPNPIAELVVEVVEIPEGFCMPNQGVWN